MQPKLLFSVHQRNPRLEFLALIAVLLALPWSLLALDGQIQIHDPSTIVRCNGRYYTYGTGGASLVSDDGWTWRRGTTPSRSGMAPDVIHVGDHYYMYIARNVGAQPRADINLIFSKSLDPESPDYKWEEGGVVAASDGVEDCNAIDPGLLLDPNDGRLWMVYGSYFGYIRLVELDPGTGKRLHPGDQPANLAINCEASVLIYHEGWYYLLAIHGSCCQGADSGYNIRMGRSRKVTGPYLDQAGWDMIKGGGKLFAGSASRHIGPGHFGLLDLGGGVQKYSCHYEADLDRGGSSVLDVRPLLWRDGWPVAGENLPAGNYRIESLSTGTDLELAVQGMPVGGSRARGGGFGRRGGRGGPGGANVTLGTNAPGAPAGLPSNGPFGVRGSGPVPPQEVAQVSTNWPAGKVDVRLANYLDQAQQKWTLTTVTNAGGHPGSAYFSLKLTGTGRTLAATEDGELVTLPAFTGETGQLWQIDQLADGSYRIMPKIGSKTEEPLVLSAMGSSSATLSRYDPNNDKHRWLFQAP